jgi:two-component system, OmpR family, sensor histidine kinase KdpD
VNRARLLSITWVVAWAAAAVAVASIGVAILESEVGVPNASSLYLVAVAAIAIRFGIPGAILTAVASVLVYDFLFVNPVHTLTVSDPGEWLNLVLLLFVAVTVGQLAALQRRRAEAALERERESHALFEMTRALAVGESTAEALPAIAAALVRDAEMDRVWIAFGADDAAERVAAKSDDSPVPWPPRSVAVLRRTSAPAGRTSWTLVRPPASPGASGSPVRHFRVRIEEAGQPIGSIWAVRMPQAPEPSDATARLLSVAADLVAQSLAHERLIDERRRAEVARQSDELKTALLESVSHDLRTPLATIRALAGTLIDPDIPVTPADARSTGASIDSEADRLNRLVGDLLDLSRIEGGALLVADEAIDLEDVVSRVTSSLDAARIGPALEADVPAGIVVRADPVLLEQALANLLDNARRHGGRDARVRVRASLGATGFVPITVEDSGPGVPDVALPRLFDKFYRAETGRAGGRSGRSGTGIGLAVVRGFVEAMGGRVSARRSELGGLAVDVQLPAAPPPVAELPTTVDVTT